MDFPIPDLMDQDACFAKRVGWVHPDGLGLACPRGGGRDGLVTHRRHRAPAPGYRCASRRRVFNVVTGNAPRASKQRPVEPASILRGATRGVSIARPARGPGCERQERLDLRHRLQHLARRPRDRSRLDDPVMEADAMDRNAGGERGCRTPTPSTRRSGAGTRPPATALGTRTGRRPAACGGPRPRLGPAAGLILLR
ncbi:MAG: hypothetical protein ACM35G_15350 [Planctomycetaceae bacterium]